MQTIVRVSMDSMFDITLLGAESVRPLKRIEFERLVALGVFEDEKVELLHGFLVRMSPQGEEHSKSITRLSKILGRALGDRADVASHSPFAAGDDSEPEPDLAVVPPIDSAPGHPAQAFLLVEASDSSLLKDRKIKAPLYAASGVPEYWILDLDARSVEVFRDPTPTGYRSVQRVGPAERITLAAFPDVTVMVAAIFGG